MSPQPQRLMNHLHKYIAGRWNGMPPTQEELQQLYLQFLQAVECVDDILFVGEFLCRLAQGRLCLEVFLEVVFACFGVGFQQVVVLFYI